MTGQPASPADTSPANSGRRVAVNVGALSAASLFRIALSFALQLLVAHFLGVAALGLYAATLAYLHLFQVISEWGLPTLLPRDLAQQPHHRRAGYRAALILQTSLAVAIGACVFFISFWLPPEFGRLLWISSMTLPFYAVMSASETLCEACERMTLVMVVEMATNALLFVASAFVLWQGGQLTHLMAVAVAVQAVAGLGSILLVKAARLLSPPQREPGWRMGWLMGRSLSFFGLSLADVLQQRMDLLLLSVLAGPIVTGVYAAANSLSRVFIKLAQSYWRALYPTLSRLHQAQRERFAALQAMALRLGWAAALFAAAMIAGLATKLIPPLFGADFGGAASALRILIWAAPLYLLEGYCIAILFVAQRSRQSLLVGLAHLAAVLIALPICFLWAGLHGAAWSVVLAGFAGVAVGVWRLPTVTASVAMTLGLMLVVALAAAAVVAYLQASGLWAVVAGSGLYFAGIWLVGGISRADAAQMRRALTG